MILSSRCTRGSEHFSLCELQKENENKREGKRTYTHKKNVLRLGSRMATHADVLTPVLRVPVFQGVPPGD